MAFNKDIHHRKSIRLRGYDYSQPGAYFITLCTHQRQPLFGDIVDGVMMLNAAGVMVEKCWRETPDHFPWVRLDEFIVMPNHVHAIIFVDRHVGANDHSPVQKNHSPVQKNHSPVQKNHSPVQKNNSPVQKNHSPVQKNHSPLRVSGTSRSLGSVIRGFKIGVTKWFRANTDVHAIWQRNYHEHIIRNEQAYSNIAEYIRTNPQRWQDDVYCTVTVQGGTRP